MLIGFQVHFVSALMECLVDKGDAFNEQLLITRISLFYRSRDTNGYIVTCRTSLNFACGFIGLGKGSRIC